MTKLVSFIVPNTLSLEKSIEEILLLDSLGVDILEVAIPCVNPFLDGELIKSCHQKALKNKTSYDTVFKAISLVKDKVKIEFVLFLYKEIIDDDFYKKCIDTNIKNLLICDLSEEDITIKKNLKEYNLNSIVLLNPHMSDEQILQKIKNSEYFIYLTSHTNKTGSKSKLDYELLAQKAKFIKAHTHTKLFIGFSIENAEQVAVLKNSFDGIIIGSKVVSFLINENYDELKDFINNIKSVIEK